MEAFEEAFKTRAQDTDADKSRMKKLMEAQQKRGTSVIDVNRARNLCKLTENSKRLEVSIARNRFSLVGSSFTLSSFLTITLLKLYIWLVIIKPRLGASELNTSEVVNVVRGAVLKHCQRDECSL